MRGRLIALQGLHLARAMTMECPTCAAPIEAGADVCLTCGRSLSTLSLGSVLASRYELLSVLGKGGMGLVYRAFDRLLEEEVAIKVLRTDLSSREEAMRRFRSEIKLARKVSHPNICRIHDYGEEGPLGYISMEILTGQDLQKTLRDNPEGLPEKDALSAILQIASGLQAIHDVGILHRDLKTANASCDERGIVRLVDFGIAKDMFSEGQTAAGESFGTPEYMSPEHCRGETLDFRSDVYALGVVAFELLTGDVPIKGSTPMATLFKQIQEEVSFDTGPGSRVPRRLVPTMRRALAKSAAERFGSAKEFASALRAAAMEAPPEEPSPSEGRARTGEPAPPPAKEEPRRMGPGFKDVRRHERIRLPTDVVLQKLGPGGKPQKKERTVAHDLSRRGMRILTSWSDLETGDQVEVAEVSGDFFTGAIVRNVSRGADHITRVGIEFVGKEAPDRLVGIDKAEAPRATPAPSPTAGSGTRASGPTPPPRGSSVREGRHSGPSLSRGPRPQPPRDSRLSVPVSPVRSAIPIHEEVEMAMRLAAESRIWEALECLSRAQVLAEGTPDAKRIRILVAETQALNPALVKAARQNLENLARTDPGYAPVHMALGRILKKSGLVPEARDAFARALALEPANREATEELAALDAAQARRS